MNKEKSVQQKVPTLWVALAIAAISIIWGSSFILVKKSLSTYSAMEVGALRIVSAALFFFPLFIKRRKYIQANHWPSFLLAGLTGNLLPAILFSIAGEHLPSALSGMLNAFTPLFTLIIGILLFQQKFELKQTGGIVLGLIGCIGLLVAGKSFSLQFNVHALWVILATFLYGINLHTVKSKFSDIHPLTSTAGVFMLIGPLALMLLAYSGFFARPLSDHAAIWPLVAAMALGLFGSAIAMVLFNQLIKWTNALVASSVTYLIPIVAVIWGLLDGESIYWSQIVFMCILLWGVYQVNQTKN
ncbi:DMT family transporter [Aquirufa rosea]|uniref:DMT family transporter n=1 Tax=Aquirufa rosea TaxID=2509241 RepID=A0A4Q1C085_9BACT|nr:DMT family transporter [Aquirufa rosea]RXK49820.1 DMT family transporter [Aquirufa rosea]